MALPFFEGFYRYSLIPKTLRYCSFVGETRNHSSSILTFWINYDARAFPSEIPQKYTQTSFLEILLIFYWY